MRHIVIKRIIFFGITIVCLAVIIADCVQKRQIGKSTGRLDFDDDNIALCFDDYDLNIKGYYNEGIFFFIPSYIKQVRLDQSSSAYKIYSSEGYELLEPPTDCIQDVFVVSPAGEKTETSLGIFLSKNLHTLHISLDDMEYYDVDHNDYCSAEVEIRTPGGRIEYLDTSALIKGRGNGSWTEGTEKKPFQIKFSRAVSPGGMKSSDKWALIKDEEMRCKLTYDMAADIGMDYAIESDYIDLYINDDYMGNYLLCHEPDIGEDDLNIGDITQYNDLYIGDAAIVEKTDIKAYQYDAADMLVPHGGYLIEKIRTQPNKRCWFKCGDIYFNIKSPDNASLEEAEYLRGYIGGIDKKLHEDSSGSAELVDWYSFARQYLITEISLNPDAAFTSYYFYKKPNDTILYAGPCWDYDGAYGKWGDFKDYTTSIFDINDERQSKSGEPALDWDRKLLVDEDYAKYVKKLFCDQIPMFEKLISVSMDENRERIYASICMDHIRWYGYKDYKDKVDGKYKYLKFFIYSRIKYLADSYGTDFYIDPSEIYDSTIHNVRFEYDDTVTVLPVVDGAQLTMDILPEYDQDQYDGWYIVENGVVDRLYSYYEPIFSDTEMILADYE